MYGEGSIYDAFPNENVLRKKTESWKGFADSLIKDDREIFLEMLNDCYKYKKAINAKGKPFPSEVLFIALLRAQHKMINWLMENRQLKSNHN